MLQPPDPNKPETSNEDPEMDGGPKSTALTRVEVGILPRTRTEFELTRQELRTLYDFAPVGYLMLDANAMVQSINRTACDLLGIGKIRQRRAALAAYVHSESCEDLFRHLEETRRHGEHSSGFLRFRNPDGTSRWIRAQSRLCQPTVDGQVYFLTVILDVTEWHRVSESVRHSERCLRELLEQLPDGVAVVERTSLIYINQTFARYMNCRNPDQMLGRALFDCVVPEERERFRKWLLAQYDEVGSASIHQTAEWRLSSQTNQERIVESSAIQTELNNNQVLVVVARDVTERNRMRAELDQANRMATTGVLAAGVAHEINNPLCYVMLNLNALQDRVEYQDNLVSELCERLSGEHFSDPKIGVLLDKLTNRHDDDESSISLVEQCLNGSERVRKIVRNLNTFSRVEQEFCDVSLRGVIDKALAISAAEVRPHAQVVVEIAHDVAVRGNEGQLCQVMLNLLVNAAHAISEGRSDRNTINVSLTRHDGWVEIEVRDTGSGIPRQQLGRVFDPFYTTKPPGRGSGLGLSLCRNYIRAHGGEILLESQENIGTRAIVRLPFLLTRTVDEILPSANVVRSPAKTADRHRVLIVDDEPEIVAAVIRMVGTRFDVVTARCGQKALDILLKDRNFDLVITDLLMSQGTGMDLHHEISTRIPELAHRIAVLTGGAHTPVSEAFLKRTCLPMAIKPLDRDELISFIERCISESKNVIDLRSHRSANDRSA